MTDYLINAFEVKGLWGYKNYQISFNDDINIIIGPNASGKTTILNLLRYVLTVDLVSLNEIQFDDLTIRLRSFNGQSVRKVRVKTTEVGLTIWISKKRFDLHLEMLSKYAAPNRRRMMIRQLTHEIGEELRNLAPAVWLPVSRRLPTPEHEEEERLMRRLPRLESVDVRLRELLDELIRYRLNLDAQLSARYKEFEKRVLQVILYSKDHDSFRSPELVSPTQEDKNQLIRAFESAGLLDPYMRKKIDEHFLRAEEAISRIPADDEERSIIVDDLFIIPLIGRTKSMVQFAAELEKQRESLFESLRRYELIVNSFLKDKQVKVLDEGELHVSSRTQANHLIKPRQLSSGEKQILILLTQALLWEQRPVVYVADEPELSLHVSWQEKLLKSLFDLGGKIQIIVATHSPDIVGPFFDKVIDLGKIS